MSKRKKQYRNKVQTTAPTVEIELSTGAIVRCLPILAGIEAIRNTIEFPEKPTYVIKGVGGSEVETAYDQAAIDDPSTPEEDKAAWAEYLADFAAVTTRRNTLVFNRVIRRGIKVIKGGMGSGGISKADFIAELKEDGADVPEGKGAFNRLYVRLEIILTPQDFEAIMTGIAIASGADAERVKEAEDRLFRAVETGQEIHTDNDADSGDSSKGQAAQG